MESSGYELKRANRILNKILKAKYSKTDLLDLRELWTINQ